MDAVLNLHCHCGAVHIAIARLPDRLIQCTCSICQRYGSLWGHLTRQDVSVTCSQGAEVSYRWGDRVIEFYHCNTCGCVTHYEGIEKTDSERLSVNFRMAPPAAYEGIEIRVFDGAGTWTFLDR